MDDLFTGIKDNDKGMGSFSLFKNGKEVYQIAIGFADVHQKISAEANTKYRIGSISKTYTAALIMQLIDEGKLQLESKLSRFYLEIPNANKITIEDLLRHQSGLFDFTQEEAYPEYMEKPRTKVEMLNIFRSHEPVFEPGTQNAYSNTNYYLLSLIAEDIAGKSFPELLQERIVKPLGFENTYYGGEIKTNNAEALSYKKEKEWVLNTQTDLSVPKGAGAIVSTAKEVSLFFIELFNGNVVNPEGLKKMTETKNGFGLGLFSYPLNDKILYGHTGGVDGFGSMAVYDPEDELAATYISNAIAFPVGDIMAGALSIYYGMEYDMPVFNKALEQTVEELQKFEGTYVSKDFPVKVDIFEENGVLQGQAAGQPPFSMEAYESNKFEFAHAGLKLEFFTEEGKMLMLQNGASYSFYLER